MEFPLFLKLEEFHQSIKVQVFTGCRLCCMAGGTGGIRIISYALQEQYIWEGETQSIHKKQLKSNFVLSCEVQTFSSMGVQRGDGIEIGLLWRVLTDRIWMHGGKADDLSGSGNNHRSYSTTDQGEDSCLPPIRVTSLGVGILLKMSVCGGGAFNLCMIIRGC